MVFVGHFQVVIEADDIQSERNTFLVVSIYGGRNNPCRIELMAPACHGRRYLRAFLGLLVLQGKLLVANRPDDNGRRVPIALYHVFELCKTFRIRTHLPRLAHHRHSQAIACFDPFRGWHVMRGANGIASHRFEHANSICL